MLPPEYVDYIHDVLVATFMPGDERVSPNEPRDRGLIESALNRPFHTAFGEDLWPSLPQKAAALFHSLTCNHCFLNGNKRTAVIALDLFLLINDQVLLLSSAEVYELARKTASANAEGRALEEVMTDLTSRIERSVLSVAALDDPEVQAKLGPELAQGIRSYLERVRKFVAHFNLHAPWADGERD